MSGINWNRGFWRRSIVWTIIMGVGWLVVSGVVAMVAGEPFLEVLGSLFFGWWDISAVFWILAVLPILILVAYGVVRIVRWIAARIRSSP